MKNQTIQPHSSRRRALWLAGGSLVIALIAAGVLFRSASVDAHSNGPAPLIAILTPQDGMSLNNTSLRVQALVAAVKSRNGESFVFNGQTVAGRNAGRVRRVDLALDGILLRSIDTSEYGRQFVTDFRVDLSGLSAGLHLLTISALQGNGNNETTKSVSTTFTLDRSLVLAETNRIEDAATPKPFAGLRVRGWDGQDDDDADEEDPWQCPPRFDLKGTIMLGTQSDGIDLATDRVVVALGSQTKVFEPGMLRCNGQEKTCRFEDSSQPFVRFIELKRKNNGRWKYRLRGVGPLPGSGSPLLSLRVGNDWGGIDLANGERLVGLRPNLDVSHQAQSSIGTGGGTVETVDASGVIIRLEIPPDALTQDTVIKITPLQASPLAGQAPAMPPGVKFEPAGLQFAEAATLTMDFSATNQTITDNFSIFLLTSPLTALPLYGTTDTAAKTLTARVRHFSELQPAEGNSNFSDLRAWADSVLRTTGNLTISEMEQLDATATLAQRLGIDNWIDLAAVSRRVEASIDALVVSECPTDTVDPSEQALRRYIQLEHLAQSFGAHVTVIRPCLQQVLEKFITRTGDAAIADPSDANRALLLSLTRTAQALGFSELQTLGLQKLDLAMRVLAARVLARFNPQRDTPAEEPARQQARAELESALLYVTTTAAEVLRVAPTLAEHIRSAIDSLNGQDMIVTVNPVLTPGLVSRIDYQTSRESCGENSITFAGPVNTGCTGTVNTDEHTGNVINYSWNHMGSLTDPALHGGPQSLPASLAGIGGHSSARFTVSQPSGNTLAWDVTASSAGAANFSAQDLSASLFVRVEFKRAGSFQVNVNPSWTTGPGLAHVAMYNDNQTSQALSFATYFGDLCEYATPGQCPSNNSQVVTIPEPGTYLLILDFHRPEHTAAALDSQTLNGSGRLVTMTFTPH